MRQFKLWNHLKTESFDFVANGCLISDISGLGLSFKTAINNRVVVGHEREFDEISMLLNFGLQSNAYTSFNGFANFISANGRHPFVLEYSVNGRTLLSDVWIKRVPKSQKTMYNILSEKILFTRISHWYQMESGSIPADPGYVEISNTFFEDLLIDVEIKASTPNDFRIQVKLADDTLISQIIVPTQLIAGTLTLFADDKYVDRFTTGVHTNGYNLISREGDTFLILEPGTYRISTNSAVTNAPVYTYKKWVID